MKIVIRAAAATAAFASLAMSGPSIAGAPGELVVTASSAEWSSAVSQDLERNVAALVDPPMQHRRVPAGTVSVRFRAGEDGAPTDVQVSRPSGSAALDAIGKRAVARLGRLPPLPAGIAADQVFEANIVVAGDRREHDRQLAALSQRAATRAARGEDRRVLVLNAGFDGSVRGE